MTRSDLRYGFTVVLLLLGVGCSTHVDERRHLDVDTNESRQLEKIGEVPTHEGLVRIQFLNDGEGWLSTGSQLWQTGNGGKSWLAKYRIEQTTPLGAIDDFHFVSRDLGVLLSGRDVYFTRDAGRTWVKTRTAAIQEERGWIETVTASSDQERIWLAGGVYGAARTRKDYVKYKVMERAGGDFRAVDGVILAASLPGQEWGVKMRLPATGPVRLLDFSDEKHGVAAGLEDVFYTETAGQRWEKAKFRYAENTSRIEEEQDAAIGSLFVLNPKMAWIGRQNGNLAKSTDGGRTWVMLGAPSPTLPFTQLYFKDPSRGYGVSAGKLYRTEDGGRSWVPVVTEQSVKFLTASPSGIVRFVSGANMFELK